MEWMGSHSWTTSRMHWFTFLFLEIIGDKKYEKRKDRPRQTEKEKGKSRSKGKIPND